MVKPTRTQHSNKEKKTSEKQPRQTTLDNLPDVHQKEGSRPIESTQKKRISISGIEAVSMEDDLSLRIEFKLLPSKTAFSKIMSDLYFDGQKLNTICIRIPQSPLAKDDFELTPVLDMKGVGGGKHIAKVEMYELWSSGEKLAYASKEATLEYVPQRKGNRLLKLPIVRRITGNDLVIVSDSEKDIYHEMEENAKRELIGRRDEW
jgi:hypothetical protein